MNVKMSMPVALLALCASAAFGQATNSADVTGTVTDSTGAVIPGVNIAIKDLDKGTEQDIVSNGAGNYDSGPIVANDRFTITFSKEGFGSLQRGPMTLEVGITGMNVQLAVGQSAQQVVVNTEAPLLETETSELSSTLPTETLQTLPQTGTPDWQSFLVLLPGTSGNGSTSTSNPGMGSLAANGSMPFSTAMLDGSTISSPMSDNVINTPIFDIIAEVKMSDSNFSAQYGTGGIIFNQISKGGSNTFHGMAYDYFQNTDLNAATYGFGFGSVPVIHWNDYGFQVSGPVIKNKFFLFLDWDRRIQHGAGSVGFATLPTSAMTSGDFTASGLPILYDPTASTVDTSSGLLTRPTFISEYGSNKIPSGLIDPVAKNIAALFPTLPSTTAFATNDYEYATPAAITDEQKWFGRFDANPTSKDHIDGSSAYNYPDPLQVTASIVYPINALVIDVENMSAQVSEVHTFSSRTINEARTGWMAEYDLLTSPTLGENWPQKLSMQYSKANIFPTINISGVYQLSPELHANYRENIFSESDVVTMIRGRHSLHLGGEIDAFRADSTAWGNINSGTFGFTGVYTAGATPSSPLPGTGAAYADFLLGDVNNWSASVTPDWYGRLKDPALFVQDDWKVSPKLTVNLGLRWEGRTGWSDPTNNERSFDTTIINPATGAGGGMWYAATHTNGRTRLEQDQWNNWLPRVGAAYQFGTKTVVRGGFGMYTFPWNTDNYAANYMNAYGSSGAEADTTGNVEPVAFLGGTGNENPQGAYGSSVNSLYVSSPTTPQGYNGQPVDYVPYDQGIPRLLNWNATVQRQLTGSMMAEVGYVGSHSYNLIYNNDLDQVPASELEPNVNNFSSRPYPEYQAVIGFNTQATSVYNALQAQLERRMANGLMFNFNYTWSHMTDDQDSSGWGSEEGTSVFQNSYVPSSNWGAANFDVRNMFKAYGIYDLPFGTGRRYLNNDKALDEAIGGWTMSLTFIGQGGHPFTPIMLVNDSYASSPQAGTVNGVGDFAWYPNQIGNPKAAGSSGTLNEWFNVDAFQEPTPGTLGNNHRNDVYGPGLHVINGSLHKNFPIFERVNFDFAVNATNLINHPSFANPDTDIAPGHHAQITSTTEGGRTVELVGKIIF
jgi:Carboxypeptidase regulatory-like domain